MNKIGFVSGVVSALIGCLTLIYTSIVKELLPKYVYALFETSGPGSYTEGAYALNFTFANVVAAVLIVAGLIFAAFCFLRERKNQVSVK